MGGYIWRMGIRMLGELNMAYFMVHLNIAQDLYGRHSNIGDKGAFYLGAIAPDAVAFKPGSARSDKKHSHFCIGDEDWGGIQIARNGNRT